MASFNYGYGPTIEEFEEYTNRLVQDQAGVQTAAAIAEFERQRARAQEKLDDAVGKWPGFYERNQRKLALTTSATDTFTATNMTSTKDDMYNNMELRGVQGNGSGFYGYIADWDGATATATVSGVTGSWSDVDTSSVVMATDIAIFPRDIDIDVDARPVNPHQLPRIVAYIMEYWINLESQEGWNADEITNAQIEVIQETLGDWQSTYKSQRNALIQQLGPKAYELLIRSGLLKRTAQLGRYKTPW